MHELSIALSLIEGAEDEAAKHQGRVQALYVRIGPLAGIVKEALLSAFEMARDGTMLEGARLVLEDAPVVAICPECHERRTIDSIQWFRCPVCGAPVTDVVEGRELELTAMEIE
jgi:hydrogenase nickel incorporation protein HypA/HybF